MQLWNKVRLAIQKKPNFNPGGLGDSGGGIATNISTEDAADVSTEDAVDLTTEG